MTITNFNDLHEWFKFGFETKLKSDTEGTTTSPYWTLYSVGLGSADKVLATNDRLTNLDESFKALSDTIRRMNNPAGSMFRIFQTSRAKASFPTQECRVQIFENNQISGGSMQPGIGSLTAGYVDESKIQSIVAAERAKWELEKRLEDLEAQIKAPRNWTDNALETIERIGNTPFGMVILSKISGIPPAEIMKSISGAQSTDNETPNGEADFDSDIERTTQILGVTEDELASKLRQFAEANPVMARQIFHTQ